MNDSTAGWHNAYLRIRQIESDNHLPNGSLKPEADGRFSLVLTHMTETQIQQLAHLWYVITQIQHYGEDPAPGAGSGKSDSGR